MAILATSSGSEKELVPAGNYVARCYQMIEVGTVTETINGDTKQLKKVRIGWEFPNNKKVFNEEKGPQPIVFNEEYTLSMGEKSNLRKMLESWRGKGFTPEQAKSFDVSVLIGVPCMVNIIHCESKRGTTYAKISSVSGVPAVIEVPAQITEKFILSYDDFSVEKFNSLPDFIKEKMKSSKEYQQLFKVNTGHPDGQPAPKRDDNGNVNSSLPAVDDLPF